MPFKLRFNVSLHENSGQLRWRFKLRARLGTELGELRDRTFENQAYRASGLNLIVAAVILWNTPYLAPAAADLGVTPDLMRHVAPLGWEHLSLTGDYS
jgi:TnpA family transposase